jgi:hypothetical protein
MLSPLLNSSFAALRAANARVDFAHWASTANHKILDMCSPVATILL